MNDINLIWESYSSKIIEEQNESNTSDFVNKLKKDYDTLVRNINIRLTPENALQLKDAFKILKNKYDDQGSLLYKWEQENKQTTEYVRNPLWDFQTNLGRMYDLLGDFNRTKDEINLKKLINLKKYNTKKANNAFFYFNLFISNNPSFIDKLNIEEHTFKIEGIPFIFIGLNQKNKDRLPKLKYYVNQYIERAKRVAPLLVKYGLPVKIHMEFDTSNEGDAAGLYLYNKIVLTPWASKGDEKSFIKTLAHEMGHHLYKSLSEKSRHFWYEYITKDKIEIDVEEIANMMRENEKSRDFDKRIKIENPILYLQAETLFYHHATNHYRIYDIQSLVDAYKENKIGKKITVPNTPITGYANKNPEESFCEALGLYVAYGNRAVHERIKEALNIILMPSEGYRLGESFKTFKEFFNEAR